MEKGRVEIEGNKWSGNDIGLIVVGIGWVMIDPMSNNGHESNNKYIMEVVMNSALETIMMDWTTKSTTMSISIPKSVQEGILSKIMEDVDVVCGDGLR